MNTYRFVNDLLTRIIPLVILIGTTYQMIKSGSGFIYFNFGTVIFHALTAMALCIAYVIGCIRLNYLPIPLRQIYSMSLVVAGIHFYDVFWSIGSYISRRGDFSWLSLASFFIASLLLIFLDRQNIFFEITNLTWVFFAIMIISFCAMSLTGFYSRMALYDAGVGVDPSIDNWWWVLSKITGLLVIPYSTMNGEEAKEIRWSFT